MDGFRGFELDPFELSGERLLLRSWRPTDADRVYEIMQDAEIHRWLAVPDPYTREDAAEYVEVLALEPRRAGTGICCAIVERASGRVVGSIELRLGPDAELGYWVAADARGAGYSAQACRLLVDWAFSCGVVRARILCDVRNIASARTALAAGFRFEGVARSGYIGGGSDRVPERRGDLAMFARVAGDAEGPVPPVFVPPGDLDDATVRLRPLEPEDGPALFECEDAEAVRWGFTGHRPTRSAVQAVADRGRLDWLVGTSARFAIVDVASGRLAGELTMRLPGPPQVGLIGYTVHPQFRGRGYTTRALRLLTDWAFGAAGFARLELGAKSGNVASQRAAASAGFLPDGVRRGRLRTPDGSFDDEARYFLLNPAVDSSDSAESEPAAASDVSPSRISP